VEGGKWNDEHFSTYFSLSPKISVRVLGVIDTGINTSVIPDIKPACHVVALVKTDGVMSRNPELKRDSCKIVENQF